MTRHATIAAGLAAGLALWLTDGAGAAHAFDEDVPAGPAFAHPLWAPMARQHDRERAALEACLADAGHCAGQHGRYRALLEEADGRHPLRQMQLVDGFFDALERRDVAAPRWRTLNQVLRDGGGDADIAIAKYYTLRRLGFCSDALRVVVSGDPDTQATRTVLAVRLDGRAHVLSGARGHRAPAAHSYAINELFWWDAALFGGRPRESISL